MTVKTDVNFRISAPCLSLLLHDCECSMSDQMGFLIGEESSVKTQTISDDEMEQEKVETTISINGTYPVGLPFEFCSTLGRIDDVALKEVLGSCKKDVVGWYSFRRSCRHTALLRETLLHSELCTVLRHHAPHYFLFCIVTTTASDRNATHSFKFTFYTFRNRKFHPVSVAETNLGEPEDNLFRRDTVPGDSFKRLQQVFNSLNDVTNTKMAVSTLHTEVNKHLEVLESSVSRLQCEIEYSLLRTNSSNFNCADQKSARGEESLPCTSIKDKPGELSAEYLPCTSLKDEPGELSAEY